MENPIIKLGEPIYLIKKEYKFLILVEKKEVIEEVSFFIKYRQITPKLDHKDRHHNEYSLVINKKDLTASLGHEHFDTTKVAAVHIKPENIGLGSIIFHH